MPVVVAINHFVKDTDAEVKVQDYCAMGTEAIVSKHWADGSAGSENLAKRVAEVADPDMADFFQSIQMTSLADKVQTICKRIYRADEAVWIRKSWTS